MAPSLGGESGPPTNTCFLGSTRVHKPNGILIGSSVFVGCTVVSNRQTHRQTTNIVRSSLVHSRQLLMQQSTETPFGEVIMRM